MKIIVNKYLPINGFAYMTLFWWILTRKKDLKISDCSLNHEKIHLCQIYGVWCITVPLFLLLAACGAISWWWWLALPCAYYELYFLFWVIEVLLPPYNTAYRDNCFEREARMNQDDMEYTCPRHWFSWLKYFRVKR